MHDAHCHFDLLTAQVTQCETFGVTCKPSDFQKARAAPNVHMALGLLPQEAHQLERELPLFLALLPSTRFVGEIGLDGTLATGAVQAQARVFAAILSACENKILSIHSRRAAARVLDALEAHQSCAHNKIILHWFSGTAEELARAVALGCFFSVNPAMTKSTSGKALVRLMPRQRVLLESDAPFVEGKLEDVVAYLSGIWGVSREAAETQVDKNWHDVRA